MAPLSNRALFIKGLAVVAYGVIMVNKWFITQVIKNVWSDILLKKIIITGLSLEMLLSGWGGESLSLINQK